MEATAAAARWEAEFRYILWWYRPRELGLVGQELGTEMVPAGEQGGETRRWCPRSTPGTPSPPCGMLMFRGFILGGDGISSLSRLSASSSSDWKNSRILVLGKRIEHLKKI